METFFTNPNFFKYMSNSNLLTIDMLKKYPDSPWDWKNVSKNGKISWEDIKNNPNLKWTDDIGINPNITWEIVNSPDFILFCKRFIVSNFRLFVPPNINFRIEYVYGNFYQEWGWWTILSTHNIMDKLNEKQVEWMLGCIVKYTSNYTQYFIECAKYISEQIQLSSLDILYENKTIKTWRDDALIYFLFSDREDLTLELVQKYPKFGWDWEKIFKRFSGQLKIKSE